MAVDDDTDLAERVRRLEVVVAELQTKLERSAQRAEPPAPVLGPLDGPADAAPAAPPAPAGGPPRDLESVIGTYWLSRIGVLALVTGLAWYIAVHFGDLGGVSRVGLGFGLAGALSGIGVWLGRTQRLFGHVVLGGGLAVAYFVTFALHFLPAMRIIDSQLVALVVLAFVVAFIVAVAQRLRSETLAGIALFLGLHTSLIGEVRVFSLLSTVLLAAAAMFLFIRNRWVLVPLSTLVAVYAVLGIASLRSSATPSSPGRDDVLVTLGFALLYFLVFAIPPLVRPQRELVRVALGFAIVNDAAFLALGTLACLVHDRALLLPLLGVATAAFVASAGIAHRRELPELVDAHLSAALPVAAWALGEALPFGVQAALSAALALSAVHYGIRLRTRALPLAGLATLAALLLAAGVRAEPSFVACFSIAAGSATTTIAARREIDPAIAGTLRIGGASGAAVGLVLAANALVVWPYRTLVWVVVALALVAFGLLARERMLRFAGLGVLALAAGKLLVLDLARLPTDQRILTFVVSGAILLGVSFAYARFKDSWQRFL